MNPVKRILVTAGVPPEIDKTFVQRFATISPVASWIRLPLSTTYTKEYSIRLYDRLVLKLRQAKAGNRYSLLRNTRLVLLYVDKGDGSESHLFSQFGSEALVVPFGASKMWEESLDTKNRKNRAIRLLVRDGQVALRHADILLSIIAREVGDRDNKTCLLLPPKNFGSETTKIRDCIHEASMKRVPGIEDMFRQQLQAISKSIKSVREGKRHYFQGKGRIVYRSPPKARLRHGIAPVWDDADHDSTCVIRGRIRFGASFDPKFHYDCDIGKYTSSTFASCHGTKSVAKGTTHVNISPNDNIR